MTVCKLENSAVLDGDAASFRNQRLIFVRNTGWVGSKWALNKRFRFCNIKAIIMKIVCIYRV
jgi:ATP-dependent phosphoenolpyruvate carboxykinase